MILRHLPSLMLTAFGACLVPAHAASGATPLPVSYFFKNPDIGGATLSPNGRYLATTARKLGSLQLAVMDLDTGEAKMLAGYTDLDITNVQWIGNERIAFSMIDRSTPENSAPGGLFTIDRNGGKVKALVEAPRQLRVENPVDIRSMRLIRRLRGDPAKLFAIGHMAAGGDAVPLIVDAVTGRRAEMDYRLPGKALDFFMDDQDKLRVAVSSPAQDMQNRVVWYRGDADKDFRQLAAFPALEPAFGVIGMVGETLYVSAPAGKHAGLYKYDLANNKLGELVLADKDGNVDGPLLVAPGGQLLGVRIDSEPPRTHWFDPAYATLQSAVDVAYPDTVNRIEPGAPDAPRLIYSYSSTHPGHYLRYQPATKKMAKLFATRSWVEPARMSEQLVFDYKARDGLPIMSYLTLPKGRAAKGLPLIVLPHGGPHARDMWGYSGEVQFLASRGYAVLQPQFRGSSGFGMDHFKKGFRQWGLAMQDDINDGVRNLVEQGVADPARVCIMGGSYGGYAVMMGLARDPGMYKCGINLLGVTDLSELITKGRWRNDAYRFQIKTMIGDPATMKDQIASTSPIRRAADITAPVFMAYGEKDQRVPLEHGTGMRDALKKAGKTYEWMSFSNEEHGFVHEENRFKVYTAIDAFLAKHNPAN